MKKYIFLPTVFLLVLSTASHAQSWSLTGNSGTNPPTQFLGTKDNQPLVIKTGNKEQLRISAAGKIGIGITTPSQKLDVKGNINLAKGFGLYMENHPVLRIDSAGGNTFLGNGTGPRVSGGANSALGYQALFSNTSGSWNTGVGYQALYSNSTGYDNVAVGYIALNVNSSANGNTAVGNYALLLNNGNHNTAVGTGALFTNSSGTENVATGRFALYDNSTGSYNTANGAEALNNNTSSYNTATGYRALYTNTSGYDNTAHGFQALFSNSAGRENTALGTNALYSTNGNYNTAVGDYALFNTTDAWGNTAIGDIAGASYHNGYYNTFVGAETDATAADIFNSTALGRGTRVTASSQVRIGNSFVNSIGGYANWTNISDGRVKKNIKQNVPGLTFINKLKPVTYNLDLDAADRILQPVVRKDKDGKMMAESKTDISSRNAKQQILYTGFVAQEVEKAAKEIGYDFSGVDAARNDKDLYGLRYAEFVVPLVKAVQELSKMNDDKEAKIAMQQKQIDELKQMVQALVKNGNNVASKSATTITGGAYLQQNSPNPFSQNTTIRCTVPPGMQNAQVVLYNSEGKQLKTYALHTSGRSTITISAGTLAAGTYTYTLLVDGKEIDSKSMVIVR